MMAAGREAPPSGKAGFTIVELMMSVSILSIGALAFATAFGSMSKAIQKAKIRTISAGPLVSEKMETLKRTPYYRLLASTVTATASESGLDGFEYDAGAYPSETITVGDYRFTRRVLIEKVELVGDSFAPVPAGAPDTGIKRITVYTLWQENGDWYKHRASSLYSNPNPAALDNSVGGDIRDDGGSPLSDVEVVALQNARCVSLSGSAGDYSLALPAGDYTLRASKPGYHSAYSSPFTVGSNEAVTRDFTLAAIAAGAVRGTAWINDHLVLSQVVGSTPTAGFSTEYVEIFNPTTYTWTVNGEIGLRFQRDPASDPVKIDIDIDYRSDEIRPGGYFLFANTGTVHVLGSSVAADAVWDTAPFGDNDADFPYFNAAGGVYNIIPINADGPEGEGALELYRISDGAALDRFGWSGNGCSHKPGFYETSPLAECTGLQIQEQYYRFSSTSGYDSSFGPAYDSGHNNRDWRAVNPLHYRPSNSSGAAVPVIAGVPASGVVVSADDGLSSSTTTFETGSPPYVEFELASVATGTWQVTLTSGSHHSAIGGVVVTQGGTARIPNSATAPSWTSAGYTVALLSSTITTGFIAGQVSDAGLSALSGITVRTPWGTTVTGGDGTYVLSLTPGEYAVDANPSGHPGYDQDYVSVSSGGWSVHLGQVTRGVDFTLSAAGAVSGWATMNGVDPLRSVSVLAFRSGVEMGTAITGDDGSFAIIGLSTGSYSVVPQTDTGESVSPSSASVTLSTPGETVWSATFTLSGAMGTITGTVELGGVPIETGVVIMATTGTISGSDPPSFGSALRSGGVLYYTASSRPGGTYSLEVRGGAGIYIVYGWYSTRHDQYPTTIMASGLTTVNAGDTSTVDLDW
ncbi:MAG: carboxypeptidase regulatory-like domain-containing protein [Elusimicrobiota bacterium]